MIGEYYYQKKYLRAALIEFEKATSVEIPYLDQRKLIEERITKIKKKLHDS